MGWGEKAIEIRSVETGHLDGVFMHKRAQRLKFLCERNDKVIHFLSLSHTHTHTLHFAQVGYKIGSLFFFKINADTSLYITPIPPVQETFNKHPNIYTKKNYDDDNITIAVKKNRKCEMIFL